MKNHLKRIATPPTWVIARKEQTFIARPNPGAHSLQFGLALGVVLRDMLNVVETMREAQKVLNNTEILVDGVRRKDRRHIVGLFDVVRIPVTGKQYRMVLDSKGRLTLAEIDEAEASTKLCKIVGKTAVKGGKIQYNLHDGKNILSDKAAKVGETLLVTLPQLEVKEVFPREKGVSVFLTQGKHHGDIGILKSIDGKDAVYTKEKNDIETASRNLFVVGKTKPATRVTGGEA